MTMDIKKQSINILSVQQRVRYLKLLFKWKGGIWDLLWIDFIWFLGAHILITVFYHYVLLQYAVHRERFESFLKYMESLRNLVPLSFLLGFFVSAVLARWWNVVMMIPWVSKGSFYCQSFVTGKMEQNESSDRNDVSESIKEKELFSIRMSILRYLNMAWIFTFINFSQTIKERFYIKSKARSKMKKVTDQLLKHDINERITVRERIKSINDDPFIRKYYDKFILEEEIQFLEKQEQFLSKHKTLTLDYWIPLQWALIVIRKAYRMGHISHSRFYVSMIEMVNEFRGQLGTIYVYNDWKMPLVYIQVVIFVVYSFLFTEIFNQSIVLKTSRAYQTFDFQTYFPVMTILKYFLYMGWFQIGLCLMYPFDGNNADMPLNDVLDFNIMIGTQGCNTTPDMFPVFLREEFGNDGEQMRKLTEFTKFLEHNPILDVFNVDDSDGKSKKSRMKSESLETKEIV